MKHPILLSALLIVILLSSSCNDDNNSNSGLNNFTSNGSTGVKTTTADNYTNWTGIPNIHFYTTNTTSYSYWILDIGDSHGSFGETTAGVENHWKGRISYTDKDKWCNDMVYADSLQLDITNNESGWNDVTYRTTSYKSTNGSTFAQTGAQCIYYLKTDSAGNINSISVSDANHAYMFKFKPNTTDNFNSWKIVDMQDGWMNQQARTSILLMPVLFTIFQQ